MTAAIILAAGLSSRTKSNKLLYPLGDHTVIEEVIKTLVKLDLKQIVVVLGRDESLLADLMEKSADITAFREKKGKRFDLINNPLYASGQSTSVKAGLKALSGEVEEFFFIMGDQPLIDVDVLNLMRGTMIMSRHQAGIGSGVKTIVVPTFRGIRGTPVLFDRSLINAFESIEGDSGGRQIIQNNPDGVIELPVEQESFFWDVDTETAYHQVIQFLEEKE